MKIYQSKILILVATATSIAIGFIFFVVVLISFGFLSGLLSDYNGGTSVSENTIGPVAVPVVGEEPELVEGIDLISEKEATQEPKVNPSKDEIAYWVDQYVKKYKTKPEIADIALKVIYCESTYRHYKDGEILLGLAQERGLCQFKRSTFDLFKGYYGLLDADIDNWQDQVKLLVIMLAEGQGKHWSCYKKL